MPDCRYAHAIADSEAQALGYADALTLIVAWMADGHSKASIQRALKTSHSSVNRWMYPELYPGRQTSHGGSNTHPLTTRYHMARPCYSDDPLDDDGDRQIECHRTAARMEIHERDESNDRDAVPGSDARSGGASPLRWDAGCGAMVLEAMVPALPVPCEPPDHPGCHAGHIRAGVPGARVLRRFAG